MIEPGTLLQNRYRVIRQIGQGGMGAVYVATDERFRSTVAIKQTFFDDPILSKAFEREAHLLNHLRHPALPKVSDHFTEGLGQYLVMEFIEGLDFSELLQQRNGAFPLANVLGWADELLDALEYLHAQELPVVHRDIKPQNLKLTTRGKVVLLDFGLAKGSQANTRASVADSVFGYSRHYAPLEQIQGTGTDARSDLYSLAATLYHLLTGMPPVDAVTRAGAMVNNQPDPLRPAHLVHSQVPASVSKVVHRAMAQNASRRPASAAEFRAALGKVSNDVSAYVARATAAPDPLTDGKWSGHEATVVETLTEAAGGQREAGGFMVQRANHPTSGETTLVDATQLAPRIGGTYASLEAPLPSPPSSRKLHHLLIGAVLALIVLGVSVPVMVSRRASGSSNTETEAVVPAGVAGDVNGESGANASSSLNATVENETTSSAAQPAPSPIQAQLQSGDASAVGQPSGEASSGPATGNVSGSTADVNDFSRSTQTEDASGGRPTLVINGPAPTQPSDHSKSGYEEELRQAEEARKEEARRAEALAPRREEFRPPPPGREPFPPPPDRRPPPHRPPPFR